MFTRRYSACIGLSEYGACWARAESCVPLVACRRWFCSAPMAVRTARGQLPPRSRVGADACNLAWRHPVCVSRGGLLQGHAALWILALQRVPPPPPSHLVRWRQPVVVQPLRIRGRYHHHVARVPKVPSDGWCFVCWNVPDRELTERAGITSVGKRIRRLVAGATGARSGFEPAAAVETHFRRSPTYSTHPAVEPGPGVVQDAAVDGRPSLV
jgi:hypothetical protein